MKEVSHKVVVGQNEAGFDRPTRAKALTEAAVRRITDSKGTSGFYDHLPPRLKTAVDEVVLFNSLDSDPDQVAEDVSLRVLVRGRVVPKLLADAGFTDVNSLPRVPNHADYNRSTIAGLTEKGTVVLLGAGGLMADGGGTSVSWNPLPERVHERTYVPNLEKGARIVGPPSVDEPLEIRFNVQGRYDFDSDQTAPLVQVFRGPSEAPLGEVAEQIKVVDNHLDTIVQKGQ